jgi:hypothetical protein
MTTSASRIAADVILDIAIEPWPSSALPMRRLVVIDPWSRTHEAEEDVLRRFDYDPHVSSPNYQVARLRHFDSLEPLDAGVEVGGRSVGVWEASSLINRMNEMRTIVFRTSTNVGVESGSDQGQAIILV